MHQAQRTQIYLPSDLRREVDKARALSGQSLAEYIRKALERSLVREKTAQSDLKKLADKVVGAAKGTRTKAQILAWEKEIRRDRRLADQQWESKWDKLVRKNVST